MLIIPNVIFIIRQYLEYSSKWEQFLRVTPPALKKYVSLLMSRGKNLLQGTVLIARSLFAGVNEAADKVKKISLNWAMLIAHL